MSETRLAPCDVLECGHPDCCAKRRANPYDTLRRLGYLTTPDEPATEESGE